MSSFLRIRKLMKRKAKRPSPGAPPGLFAVSSELPGMTLRVHEYSKLNYSELENVHLSQAERILSEKRDSLLWPEVQGLADAEALRGLGAMLRLNVLTVEDIAHLRQRPKIEEIDDYVFIGLQMFLRCDSGVIENEQLSCVFKKGEG